MEQTFGGKSPRVEIRFPADGDTIICVLLLGFGGGRPGMSEDTLCNGHTGVSFGIRILPSTAAARSGLYSVFTMVVMHKRSVHLGNWEPVAHWHSHPRHAGWAL